MDKNHHKLARCVHRLKAENGRLAKRLERTQELLTEAHTEAQRLEGARRGADMLRSALEIADEPFCGAEVTVSRDLVAQGPEEVVHVDGMGRVTD